ncbi:MAG TPA: hypothetical protein VGF49_20715 [Candidatus Solibacter sp.]|jgi:hypothetical protein
MVREDGRFCDGCAQKLPPMAKLGQQTMSKEEAREYGSLAEENADGTVTIDLCLACRIHRAERMKGR